MPISRRYLPTLTGGPDSLLAAAYRAVLMAVKQERINLDVNHIITDKERVERDPAVVYWHKALLDGMNSRVVDLVTLHRQFPTQPVSVRPGIASSLQEIYSKLPSLLITRLLTQSMRCSCGAVTNRMFPMCAPAHSDLVTFIEEASSLCPVCKKAETLLSRSVPVLLFLTNREKHLALDRDARRSIQFSGLTYLAIGFLFLNKSGVSSDPVLRGATVSPLSGEADMYCVDGKIDQEGTELLRRWLDGIDDEIGNLICVGMFLLNKPSAAKKATRLRKGTDKHNGINGSQIAASPRFHSQNKARSYSYSSYSESSTYEYSYSTSFGSQGISDCECAKAEKPSRTRTRQRDTSIRLNRGKGRNKTLTPNYEDSHEIVSAYVPRGRDVYKQPTSMQSSQTCSCCGDSCITAMWIIICIIGVISLINLILACVLFSKLR